MGVVKLYQTKKINMEEKLIKEPKMNDYTITYERSAKEQESVVGYATISSCRIKEVDEISAILKFRNEHPNCTFCGMIDISFRN